MRNAIDSQFHQPVARLTAQQADFAREVSRRANVNITRCWHCKCCSNGCPFADSMDFYPNQVIRLTQLGLKRQALASSSIWICVGCNTCSVECPQAIDVAAVMDALRQMAIAEGVAIGEPGILDFHRKVIDSIQRYGRTHKLEIMMRYKFKKQDWLSDVNVAMRMLSKRKLDLRPSRVKHLEQIQTIFQNVAKAKERAQRNR